MPPTSLVKDYISHRFKSIFKDTKFYYEINSRFVVLFRVAQKLFLNRGNELNSEPYWNSYLLYRIINNFPEFKNVQ